MSCSRQRRRSSIGVALALSSAALWGCSDFFGGAATRRLPVAAVTLISQVAGFAGLLVVFAFVRAIDWRSFELGALAGVAGAIGLTLLYRALAIGTMSVIAPIVSCGTIIPVALAIARGERPSSLALAGVAAAVLGIVLASLDERRSLVLARRDAIPVALGAAVACGLFLYFLGVGARGGSAYSTLLGARVFSLAVLAAAAVRAGVHLRRPPRVLGQVALIGIADLSANALFAAAAGYGLLSIVSVIGSLYPIVTVMLAYALLGERITRSQRLGVALALVGVSMISLS